MSKKIEVKYIPEHYIYDLGWECLHPETETTELIYTTAYHGSNGDLETRDDEILVERCVTCGVFYDEWENKWKEA